MPITDNIVLAGDSWAAGVWNESGDKIYNTGFALHLQSLGYNVINLSFPGGSNLQSINRIRDFLRCNQDTKPKFILFWMTEFFREIWYYQAGNINNNELTYAYPELKDRWIYRPYYQLSELYQEFKIPTYIIGGCSDTIWYDNFETDFPGIKILIQSSTNLLINNNHRIDNPVFCQFINGWIDNGNFLEVVKRNISNHDLEILINDIDLGNCRVSQYRDHPELFFPDGIHPNATAQKELFDFAILKINDLQNH